MRAFRRLSIASSSVLLAAGFVAASAAPALAAAPTVERAEVNFTIPDFLDCGGSTLAYHALVRRSISEYRDADGNLVRWVANVHYAGSVINTTTGLSATDSGARIIEDDFRRQQTTITGGAHHVTWPGGGLVFGEIGRLTFDWNGTPDNFDDDVLAYAAGIHQEPEIQQLLCAVLG